MDNTTSANKNIIVISWLTDLVKRRVFTSVYLCFLPVGHTHDKVDAFIGSVNKKISRHNVMSLKDYQRLIGTVLCRNKHPLVKVFILSCSYLYVSFDEQ